MVKPKLSDFLDTWDEWHSFWVGFCESLHFRKPAFVSEYVKYMYLSGEFHYYMLGRAIGSLVMLGVIVGIVKLFI